MTRLQWQWCTFNLIAFPCAGWGGLTLLLVSTRGDIPGFPGGHNFLSPASTDVTLAETDEKSLPAE